MSITLTPFGGLSQIGGNSMFIEKGESSFLIDYGILFPYNDSFDINYLIPNINQITKRPDVLIVTHGHEDHIGAIPHLLEKFPGLHIVAPPFAAKLIHAKCDFFHRELKYTLSNEIDAPVIVGDLELHYIKVNHSIPDTYGILICDKAADACSFFISDFKIDTTNYFEEPFEFKRLEEISSKYNTRLLMADSTNILSSNKETPSEESLIKDLEEIISAETTRVIVTTFSSNITRIKTLIELARKHDRKICLYGRSLQRYAAIAEEIGYLPPLNDIVDIEKLDSENEKCLIIVSGCQADFRSTFRRVAHGTDSRVTLNRKDVVVLSSKTIPGNEKNVSMALNQISKAGANIITANDKHIHASGHAGSEDLKTLFNVFKPSHHIPIHGETFFLERHKHLISKISNCKVKSITNYTSVTFPSFKEFDRYQEDEPIIIHGKGLELTRDNIRERRKVSTNGLIFVSIGKKVNIETIGISFDKNNDEEKVMNLLRREVQATRKNLELMKVHCRRVITNLYGTKPVVMISETD
jgi:ribonuclease J